jgi:hypothetical protein
MSERSLEQVAADQMQRAGFFVERDGGPSGTRKKGANAIAADLTAWATDEGGELAPEVVVEVKAKLRGPIDNALAQLSRVAAVLGARRAFFFDGRWHEADPTFTRLQVTECPSPQVPAVEARVPRRLLERELWALRDRERHRGRETRGADWAELVLHVAAAEAEAPLSRLCRSPRSRLSLARTLAESVGEFVVPELLVDAMVRLLAPADNCVVLDPVCRLGGTLWGVGEAYPGAVLQGWWPDEPAVGVASDLGRFCNLRAEFSCTSFEEILARDASVDAAIGVLPFGVKLPHGVALKGGAMTMEFDVALLDRIGEWLRPGGRAVMAVSPSVLFSASAPAAELRARLAADLRVVAVIELPSGVLRGNAVRLGVVVLERRPPTETLVARLQADWASQLSPTGEFYGVYRRHLDGETP